MARLFENNDAYYFTPDEELVFPLNENNYFANLHREQPWIDRIGIEDPSDKEWWTWFRADQDPETFNQMVEVAYIIGTVLIRNTALTEIEAQFDKRHEVTDEMIQEFYDGTSETE